MDIYNFWIRQLCSSKHATQSLPELVGPKKHRGVFPMGENASKFHPMVGKRLSCGPMGLGLRPRSFRRIDMGPRFFASGGVGGWNGSLIFFLAPTKFLGGEVWEVCVPKRLDLVSADGWCGVLEMFFDGHSSQRALVISGRFSPQKKGFTISRSLRCKIVSQTRCLWPVITSQMWKFSCLATAKEATLSTITTCFVLQGNNKLSIHRSCAFFAF